MPLHAANYPSATHYDTRDYDTIENPMVTGGSPSNVLALTKYESMKRNKANNPFKTDEKSHDNVLKMSNFDKNTLAQTAQVGPGRYSPQNVNSIGGTDY